MKTKKCPCCGIGDVDAEYDSFDICLLCGWEDDSIQNEDPDFEGGANDLSLNQHRKEFQEKIKDNPDYSWAKEADEYFRTSQSSTSKK